MESTTQPQLNSESKSKGITIIIAIVVIVLLALLWWWQSGNPVKTGVETNVPNGDLSATPVPLEDTTPVINNDLKGINNVDIKKELQQINTDINSL